MSDPTTTTTTSPVSPVKLRGFVYEKHRRSTLAKRSKRATALPDKYAKGATPVILFPNASTRTALGDEHLDFCILFPPDTTLSQLNVWLRRGVDGRVESHQALIAFVNGTLYSGSTLVSTLPRDEDGFVYVEYAVESAFGSTS